MILDSFGKCRVFAEVTNRVLIARLCRLNVRNSVGQLQCTCRRVSTQLLDDQSSVLLASYASTSDRVDDVGNPITKALPYFLDRDGCVFDNVMEPRGNDILLAEIKLLNDLGNVAQVNRIGLGPVGLTGMG